MSWYVVQPNDTWNGLAARFYPGRRLSDGVIALLEGNPGRVTPVNLGLIGLRNAIGRCIWVPYTRFPPQCKRFRGDLWNIAGNDLWGNFDFINHVMTWHMNHNRDYIYRTYPSWIARKYLGTIDFILRVRAGGVWDYKIPMKGWFHAPNGFWIAVRDDPAPEVLRWDVWGNIHYAYVGRSIGISEWALWIGQRNLGGINDDTDDQSVRLGFELWRRYGFNLTDTRVRWAVRNAMPRFREGRDNGVRTPLTFLLR
jgi:hypothetical protein